MSEDPGSRFLRIRKFRSYNAQAIKKIIGTRRTRIAEGRQDWTTENNPVALQHIVLTTTMDENYRLFAQLVGVRAALTYLVRVLQFVAKGHALDGNCPVPRQNFGPRVLSDDLDAVSRKDGEKVWDALVKSGIATEYDPIEEHRRNAEAKDRRAAELLAAGVLTYSNDGELVPHKRGRDKGQSTERAGDHAGTAYDAAQAATRVRTHSHSLSQSHTHSPSHSSAEGSPHATEGGGDGSASPLTNATKRTLRRGLRAAIDPTNAIPADVRKAATELAHADANQTRPITEQEALDMIDVLMSYTPTRIPMLSDSRKE